MAALLAALKSLPTLISLGLSLLKLIMQSIENAQHISSVDQAFQDLANSKTSEDKANAAKALADAVANFPAH